MPTKTAGKKPKTAVAKKPKTAHVLRYAHPFFTPTPPANRPQTPYGKRMVDWAKQDLGPIPTPRSGAIMRLAEIIGDPGTSEIAQTGEIRFHATGDTGNLHGQDAENVSQTMAADYDVNRSAQNPAFLLHLGDVIYGPHKDASYRDEFYRPYKGYPGKIVAIPGNHDGEVFKPTDPKSLQSFLDNFCAKSAVVPPVAAAVRILRETMTQPGVYWWLDAPFVDIVGLYTNYAEGPGFLEGGPAGKRDMQQITWLAATLSAIAGKRKSGPKKALMIATHHPPFSSGGDHGGSPALLAEIDQACNKAGICPDAVLSGHSHNYQRYTRTVAGMTIPYIVAGMGGHGVTAMRTTTSGNAIRTPMTMDNTLTLASYDDTHYGYMRVIVNATTLRMEFHPAEDGGTTKTPDDAFTLNLKTRAIT